ncbi:MAG: tetratricopeptide repeat-containing protein [Desulfofustis sp.]|nr:tetratricopeptide repeat-containing protein [Desulfofustis sp.]
MSIDPGNPYALVNLGMAIEKEGEYEQAIQLHERVLVRTAGQDGGASAAVPPAWLKSPKKISTMPRT